MDTQKISHGFKRNQKSLIFKWSIRQMSTRWHQKKSLGCFLLGNPPISRWRYCNVPRSIRIHGLFLFFLMGCKMCCMKILNILRILGGCFNPIWKIWVKIGEHLPPILRGENMFNIGNKSDPRGSRVHRAFSNVTVSDEHVKLTTRTYHDFSHFKRKQSTFCQEL